MSGAPITNGFVEPAPHAAILRCGQAEAGLSWFIEAIADALAPRLLAQLQAGDEAEDRWMDSKEASAYLDLSPGALHKLTSARTIPFEQEGRGCKLWFRRSELDAWRRGEGGPH